MKTKIICLLLAAWTSLASAQTANDYINQGRAALVAQDLWGAHTNFSAALALSPTNETANAFVAITRLLTLPQQPAGSNFLNQLGFARTNRNIYHWLAQMPENIRGDTVFPANYSAASMVAFGRTNILAAVAASATNLANIKSSGFTLSLSASEDNVQAVTLDFGDILLFRSFLAGGQNAIYLLNAGNENVIIPAVQAIAKTNGLTIQSFLAAYPNFLTLANASDLPLAKGALTNAIALYFAASDYIRNQRSPDMGYGLFEFDTNYLAEEFVWRAGLSNVLQAVKGPLNISDSIVQLTAYLRSAGLPITPKQASSIYQSLPPSLTLNGSNLFAGGVSPRSLMPKFDRNSYVLNSFPDYNFKGLVKGVPAYATEGALRQIFRSPAGIYTGMDWWNDATFALVIGTNHTANVIYFCANNGVGGSLQIPVLDFGGWQIHNKNVDGSGDLSRSGQFDGSLDFTNGFWAYPECQRVSATGPYGKAAGFYSGTLSVAGKSIPAVAILSADGQLFYSNAKADGTLFDGGIAYNDFELTNSFFGDSENWVGVLNPSTFKITGSVTNDMGGGTFTLTRASQSPYDAPPTLNPAQTNKTGIPGGAITLSVNGSGGAPLCYQWYCNGTPIAGATTNSLSLTNISPTAGGNQYKLVLHNVAGEADATITLIIQDTNKPTLNLANLTNNQVVGNQTFTVSGAAKDNSGVAQVWYQLNGGAWTPAVSTNGWTNWTATLPLVLGTNVLKTYAVDVAGHHYAYISDMNNQIIRKLTPSGMVTTVAGNTTNLPFDAWSDSTITNAGYADGFGSAAIFDQPSDVAVDSAGNIYVADTSNSLIRKITPAGAVTTLAGNTNDLAIGFKTNSEPNMNYGYADGASSAAGFNWPESVAVDVAGNVYVADSGNNLIRKITPAGQVSTLAGDTNDLALGEVNSGYQDGAGGNAQFNSPSGVALDGFGNLYVADTGNNLIRKITVDGTVSTVAGNTNYGYADGQGSDAKFNWPTAVATDLAGNVYVADSYNNLIRKVSPCGLVTTLAGDTNDLILGNSNSGYNDAVGGAAQFSFPADITVDYFGNVYVTEFGNNIIRRVAPNGAVTTVAGPDANTQSHYGDAPGFADGVGNNARFYYPSGIALDNSGGNLSTTNTTSFIYALSAPLQIRMFGLGSLSPNLSNALLQIGRNYSITASPASGFVFTNWTVSTNWATGTTTNSRVVRFVMSTNLTLLASLIETSRPVLTISSPANNSKSSNAMANVIGKASDKWQVTGVWYQLNNGAWNLAVTTNSYTNWNATLALVAGTNIINAYATDLGGNFSATNKISVISTHSFQLQLSFGASNSKSSKAMAKGLTLSLQVSSNLTGHIEYSTNFVDWVKLMDFAGSGPSLNFQDPHATNAPARFYRAVIP